MRHQGAPIVTSNFPLRYQGVSIYHCVIKGSHPPPPSRQQRDPIFQNTPCIWDIGYRLKSAVFKIISAYRDKRVKRLSRVYVEGRVKGIRLWSMEGPESPVSMGPECPRYATDRRYHSCQTMLSWFIIICCHLFVLIFLCTFKLFRIKFINVSEIGKVYPSKWKEHIYENKSDERNSKRAKETVGRRM